ncbi:uncharacterized protein LOC113234442 [Hyposmocoma kahamanoa]|uniref:uncharacterized protein LOC113234442 n=1 Tax=Hyposmocoma kahamanoa TaxID=1477025 RepID=UPI000E6D7544|nr:uncharacterized protein LOC113234442 [Hyposmocoma kahamanoa]
MAKLGIKMKFSNGICEKCAAIITNFDKFLQKVQEIQVVLDVCTRRKLRITKCMTWSPQAIQNMTDASKDSGNGTNTNIEHIDGNMAMPVITNASLKESAIKDTNINKTSTFTKTFVPCPKRCQVNNPGCEGNDLLGNFNNITDQDNDLISQGNNFEKDILCDQPESAPLAVANSATTEVNLNAPDPLAMPNCDLPKVNVTEFTHILCTKTLTKEQSVQDDCTLKPINSLQPSKSFKNEVQRQDEEDNHIKLRKLTTEDIKQMQDYSEKDLKQKTLNRIKINKLYREILSGTSNASTDNIITEENKVTDDVKHSIERVNEKIIQLESALPNPGTDTNIAVLNDTSTELLKTDFEPLYQRHKRLKPRNNLKGAIRRVKVVVKKPEQLNKPRVEKRIVKLCNPVAPMESCSDSSQIKPSNTEIVRLNDNSSPLTETFTKKVPVELDNNSLPHKALIGNIKMSDHDQDVIDIQPGPQIKNKGQCIEELPSNNELAVNLNPINIVKNFLSESVLEIPGKQVQTSDLQISETLTLKNVENALLLKRKRNNLRKVLNESKMTNEKEINKEKEIDSTSIDTNLDEKEDKQCSDYSETSKSFTSSLKLDQDENGTKIIGDIQNPIGTCKKPCAQINQIKKSQVLQEVPVSMPTEIQKEAEENEIEPAQDNLSEISNMPIEHNKKILQGDLICFSTNNQGGKINAIGNRQDNKVPLKGTQMILTKVQSKVLASTENEHLEVKRRQSSVTKNFVYPVITSVQTLDEQETRTVEKERSYNLIEHDYCAPFGSVTRRRKKRSIKKRLHKFSDNGAQNNMQLEEPLSDSVPSVTVLPIITSVVSITEDAFAKEIDNQEKNMYRCNSEGYIDQNTQDYSCDDIGQRNGFAHSAGFEKELEERNEVRIWSDKHYDAATLCLVTSNEETVCTDINAIDTAATLSVVMFNKETVNTDNAMDVAATSVAMSDEETLSIDSMSYEQDFYENDTFSFIDENSSTCNEKRTNGNIEIKVERLSDQEIEEMFHFPDEENDSSFRSGSGNTSSVQPSVCGSSLQRKYIGKLKRFGVRRNVNSPTAEENGESSDEDEERRCRAWRNSILLVCDRLRAHQYAADFLYPVKESNAPFYYSVVKRPMDLSTIRKRIKDGLIRTTADFERDLLLMISNAIMYNDRDYLVHFIAKEFLKEITYELHVLKTINEKSSLLDSINKRKQVLSSKLSSASTTSTATTAESKTSTKATSKVGTSTKCKRNVPPKKAIVSESKKNKLTTCTNDQVIAALQAAPILKVLLNKIPDKDLPTNISTTQKNNEDKKCRHSFLKSILEDQPLLEPIIKRRRKSIYTTCNNINEHTSEINKPLDYSKNAMDEVSNSGDSDTNSEERFILNDEEPMTKNISISEILETIIGVNSDQIRVDFYNEDSENGIILGTGDIIDLGNAADITSVHIKTKITTTAAVEDLDGDNVFLEMKEDNNIVTTETKPKTMNANAEIDWSLENNQTLNTVQECAMQSNGDENDTETDSTSSLVLDNCSTNIEVTTFKDADLRNKFKSLANNHVDLENPEECLVKNKNIKDTLLELSCENETVQEVLSNQIASEDCIEHNIIDEVLVNTLVNTSAVEFSDVTVKHTFMMNNKSNNTPRQSESTSNANKDETLIEQYVEDKGIPWSIVDTIENNEFNEYHAPFQQYVEDAKLKSKNTPMHSGNILNSDMSVPLEEQHAADRVIPCSVEDRIENNEFNNYHTPTTQCIVDTKPKSQNTPMRSGNISNSDKSVTLKEQHAADTGTPCSIDNRIENNECNKHHAPDKQCIEDSKPNCKNTPMQLENISSSGKGVTIKEQHSGFKEIPCSFEDRIENNEFNMHHTPTTQCIEDAKPKSQNTPMHSENSSNSDKSVTVKGQQAADRGIPCSIEDRIENNECNKHHAPDKQCIEDSKPNFKNTPMQLASISSSDKGVTLKKLHAGDKGIACSIEDRIENNDFNVHHAPTTQCFIDIKPTSQNTPMHSENISNSDKSVPLREQHAADKGTLCSVKDRIENDEFDKHHAPPKQCVEDTKPKPKNTPMQSENILNADKGVTLKDQHVGGKGTPCSIEDRIENKEFNLYHALTTQCIVDTKPKSKNTRMHTENIVNTDIVLTLKVQHTADRGTLCSVEDRTENNKLDKHHATSKQCVDDIKPKSKNTPIQSQNVLSADKAVTLKDQHGGGKGTPCSIENKIENNEFNVHHALTTQCIEDSKPKSENTPMHAENISNSDKSVTVKEQHAAAIGTPCSIDDRIENNEFNKHHASDKQCIEDGKPNSQNTPMQLENITGSDKDVTLKELYAGFNGIPCSFEDRTENNEFNVHHTPITQCIEDTKPKSQNTPMHSKNIELDKHHALSKQYKNTPMQSENILSPDKGVTLKDQHVGGKWKPCSIEDRIENKEFNVYHAPTIQCIVDTKPKSTNTSMQTENISNADKVVTLKQQHADEKGTPCSIEDRIVNNELDKHHAPSKQCVEDTKPRSKNALIHQENILSSDKGVTLKEQHVGGKGTPSSIEDRIENNEFTVHHAPSKQCVEDTKPNFENTPIQLENISSSDKGVKLKEQHAGDKGIHCSVEDRIESNKFNVYLTPATQCVEDTKPASKQCVEDTKPKSKNTPMQLENISSSDKGVTLKEQHAGDKGIPCSVEDRIENNKINVYHIPTTQCVEDTKPRSKNTLIQSDNISNSGEGVTLKEQHAVDKESPCSIEGRIENNEFNKYAPSMQCVDDTKSKNTPMHSENISDKSVTLKEQHAADRATPTSVEDRIENNKFNVHHTPTTLCIEDIKPRSKTTLMQLDNISNSDEGITLTEQHADDKGTPCSVEDRTDNNELDKQHAPSKQCVEDTKPKTKITTMQLENISSSDKGVTLKELHVGDKGIPWSVEDRIENNNINVHHTPTAQCVEDTKPRSKNTLMQSDNISNSDEGVTLKEQHAVDKESPSSIEGRIENNEFNKYAPSMQCVEDTKPKSKNTLLHSENISNSDKSVTLKAQHAADRGTPTSVEDTIENNKFNVHHTPTTQFIEDTKPRSKITLMQLDNISNSDEGVTLKEQHAVDKESPCYIEGRIENNEFNKYAPSMQCVEDTKPNPKNTPLHSENISNSDKSVTLKEQHAGDKRTPCSVEKRIENNEFDKHHSPTTHCNEDTKPKNTLIESKNISTSDKDLTLKEQHAGDKGTPCLIEGRIGYNEFKKRCAPSKQCVAGTKRKSKRILMQSKNISNAYKGLTLKEQHAVNKVTRRSVEDRFENNECNKHYAPTKPHVKDTKRKYKNTPIKSGSNSTSHKVVTLKERHVGDKETSTKQSVANTKLLINKLDSFEEPLQISNLENITKSQLSDKTADMAYTEGTGNTDICTSVQTYYSSLGVDNNETAQNLRSQHCKRNVINENVNIAKNNQEINKNNATLTHKYATINTNNIGNEDKITTLDISQKNSAVIQHFNNSVHVEQDQQNSNYNQETTSTSESQLSQYSVKLTKVLQPTSEIVEKTMTNWNDKFIMTHTKATENLTLPSVHFENSNHNEKYCELKRNTDIDATQPLAFDVFSDVSVDSDNEDLGQDIILEQVNAVIAKLDEQLMILERGCQNKEEQKCYDKGAFGKQDRVLDDMPLLEIGNDKNDKAGIEIEINPRCKNMKCPPITDPICTEMSYKDSGKERKNYIIMINKCEMNYVNCHKGVNVKEVSMKECNKQKKMRNSGGLSVSNSRSKKKITRDLSKAGKKSSRNIRSRIFRPVWNKYYKLKGKAKARRRPKRGVSDTMILEPRQNARRVDPVIPAPSKKSTASKKLNKPKPGTYKVKATAHNMKLNDLITKKELMDLESGLLMKLKNNGSASERQAIRDMKALANTKKQNIFKNKKLSKLSTDETLADVLGVLSREFLNDDPVTKGKPMRQTANKNGVKILKKPKANLKDVINKDELLHLLGDGLKKLNEDYKQFQTDDKHTILIDSSKKSPVASNNPIKIPNRNNSQKKPTSKTNSNIKSLKTLAKINTEKRIGNNNSAKNTPVNIVKDVMPKKVIVNKIVPIKKSAPMKLKQVLRESNGESSEADSSEAAKYANHKFRQGLARLWGDHSITDLISQFQNEKGLQDEVDLNEYKATCPTKCPIRTQMVCSRCGDKIYRTFQSICHMKMFQCKYPTEKLQLVAREPCALSTPYLRDMRIPTGRLTEPNDDDVVLRYIKCQNDRSVYGQANDPRCNLHGNYYKFIYPPSDNKPSLNNKPDHDHNPDTDNTIEHDNGQDPDNQDPDNQSLDNQDPDNQNPDDHVKVDTDGDNDSVVPKEPSEDDFSNETGHEDNKNEYGGHDSGEFGGNDDDLKPEYQYFDSI